MTLYVVPNTAKPITQGNIDLLAVLPWLDSDGTVRTVYSTSFSIERGRQLLIPRVGPSGELWTATQALLAYKKNGKHLGIFRNKKDVDKYAIALSNAEAVRVAGVTPAGNLQTVPNDQLYIEEWRDIDFGIKGLTRTQASAILDNLTEGSISWAMDGVSELSFSVHDANMTMFLNNYFQARRDISFQGAIFEIAATEISQGEGSGALASIDARLRSIQSMKRAKDQEPKGIQGVTATDYAALAAAKFGLGFVGEPTTTRRSVHKATGADSDESIWTVIQRLASEAQFVAFEADGRLYFASQEWLLGKWGNYTFTYPSPEASPFQLLEIPNCRRSDDAPVDVEGTLLLARSATTMELRPGMTFTLAGMGEFDRDYLIAEVTYTYNEPDPVGISFRTPVRRQPKR